MTPEEHKAYIEYMDENFDEKEFVIVPETFWGELVYIFYIVRDMLQTKKNIKRKTLMLKRQICFFKRWQCLKYNIMVEETSPFKKDN